MDGLFSFALLQEGDSAIGLLVILFGQACLYLLPPAAVVFYLVRRWRRKRQAGIGDFTDAQPRKGIVYTQSELKAMLDRREQGSKE